jgi:hypothetical protein
MSSFVRVSRPYLETWEQSSLIYYTQVQNLPEKMKTGPIGTAHFKNVNNHLNTNIYSYLVVKVLIYN